MNTPKPLHLKIEWNGQLKVKENLSPKFVMSGDDLRKLESISCVLDPRLPQTYWESDPIEHVTPENPGWSFTERLSLNSDDNSPLNGVFTIDFSARFKIIQDCQLVTADYKTTILLEVKDNSSSAITVKAKGSSLVRIKNNSNGPVYVEADGDSTVDITPPYFQSPLTNEQSPANISEVDLEPCFVQPIKPSGSNPFLFLQATLSDGQERFFQIAARQEVILGRSRKAAAFDVKASDFIYRFYGCEKDPDPVSIFLSNRISRNQLRMTLSEKGLELENPGSEIICTLENERFSLNRENPKESVDLTALDGPINMKFARLSSVILEKFSAQPAWNDRIEKILLKNYQHLSDCLCNPLWSIGTSLGVNSIRLKRMPKHPADCCDLQFIKKLGLQKDPNLSMDSPWWTSDLMANKEEYHLIVRMLTIGSNSFTDAICFDREGMEGSHAILYFCDNHFGLINHSSTAIVYHQYGKKNLLFQDECLPLQPGMTFKIGSVDFHIFECYSNYLDLQRQKLEESQNQTDKY